MLVSDINDYRTENIVHPSQNMSTYGMKFAFLLKDNNNKTCHRICTTFIVVFMHNIFINQSRGCVYLRLFSSMGALVLNRGPYLFQIIFTPGPCSSRGSYSREYGIHNNGFSNDNLKIVNYIRWKIQYQCKSNTISYSPATLDMDWVRVVGRRDIKSTYSQQWSNIECLLGSLCRHLKSY